MDSSSADSLKLLCIGASFVIVLIFAVRGWRLGIVRQVFDLLAIVASIVAGYLLGGMAALFLKPLEFPDPVLHFFGSVVCGVGAYLLIKVGAAIVFKKTSQQSIRLVRYIFGSSGAVLGAVLGGVVLIVLAIGIRLAGSMAEGNKALPKEGASSRGSGREAEPQLPLPPQWIIATVRLKEVLENGGTGALLKQLDPIPGTFYGILGKAGSVLSNPQATDRFLSFPSIKPLAESPKIAALRNDPNLVHAVQAGDYVALLRNPRVIDVINDPELASLLKHLEFGKALDYANAPTSSPESVHTKPRAWESR